MLYLITQVLLILIAAALLGSALGWLIRGVKAKRSEADLTQQIDDADRAKHSDMAALSSAEQSNTVKDQSISSLERQLADAQSKNQRLTDELAEGAAEQTEQANQNLQLQQKIEEYRDTDGKLRERIRRLEAMLSDAYRQSGQELLARIIELEAMLETERRKAEVLPDSPEISDIKFRVQAGKASVNSSTSNLMVFFASRPHSMFASAPDKIDDLKRVSGITSDIEVRLNELGIYQLSQLAELSLEEVSWLDHHLTQYRGFIRNDDWVKKAQRLIEEAKNQQSVA